MSRTSTHTASEIVALIRATNGAEFALSGHEAELLVNLFASVAACTARADETRQAAARLGVTLGAAS